MIKTKQRRRQQQQLQQKQHLQQQQQHLQQQQLQQRRQQKHCMYLTSAFNKAKQEALSSYNRMNNTIIVCIKIE